MKSSDRWPCFAVRHLTQAIRTRGDAPWTTFITAVGNGTAPYVSETTGLPLRNQEALQRAGGPHWIAIPSHLVQCAEHDGIRVVFDAAELQENVHPRGELLKQ